MSMYEQKYNMCTADYCSVYSDDLEEIKQVCRERGVRFITTGYADVDHSYEGGTLYTRRTDGEVPLFETFRDNKAIGASREDDDFAGFLPVTYEELRIALDALKAHREPKAWLTREEYDRLHERTQRLYSLHWDEQTKTHTYELLTQEAA